MVRVICIVGDAASGKTSTARELVRRLPGWRFVSTGERFRTFCDEHGIDLSQVPLLPDSQHLAADEAMKRTLQTESRIVAEGRLVAYLATGLPDALRVFVSAPIEVRVLRYANREHVPEDEARRHITGRDHGDLEKFRAIYHIDYHDPRYYDLVIDNTDLTIEQVADRIMERLNGHL